MLTGLETVSESVSKETLMCVEHNLGSFHFCPSFSDSLRASLPDLPRQWDRNGRCGGGDEEEPVLVLVLVRDPHDGRHPHRLGPPGSAAGGVASSGLNTE